ncbi:uncharacterized protein A4U43_C03F23220 [Asparagus officinalis]|uniref:Kinesin motor domain-containing protein n=1 Tax=Asparagus officinalis TaxID=4686 RepID=A0A5P1FGM8_ASPOF|nr:uncharacterized protein A4U43_C03F23220 [Asparagus officinalis]
MYSIKRRGIRRSVIDSRNPSSRLLLMDSMNCICLWADKQGKTFTVNGSEDDPGIIHCAVKGIFHSTQMNMDREFIIRCPTWRSTMKRNDLLMLRNQKLPIHESLDVSNTEDPELSGDVSNADAIRVSVLNLVDLVGSERIAKIGVGGVRLKEGKYIKKSLMIHGSVINKLSENGKQRAHIPYHDSKLTHILQPALVDNAKTSITCKLAPEEVHIKETRGTLQFVSGAKHVTSYAQVNEALDLSPIPDNFASVADEDLWLQLNTGCITNLDMLQMTPNIKHDRAASADASLELAFHEGASKEKSRGFQSEFSMNKSQFNTFKQQYTALESECNLLREEEASLNEALSVS